MRPRHPHAAVLAIALTLPVPALSACHPQQIGNAAAPSRAAATPSRPTDPTPQPATLPRPTQVPVVPDAQALLAGADPTDPTAVAAVFARDSWTLDTSSLASEAAAEARLNSLMTPSLAAEIGGSSQALPGSTFTLWQTHHVLTTAQVAQTHDSGAPPDTATTAYRSFAVTVTAHAADGWVGTAFLDVEFLTLSRPGPGGAWRVAQVS